MNNTFSISRFGKYFKYDFMRWVSSYGLTLIVTSLMPLILYLIVLIYSALFTEDVHVPDLTARIMVMGIVSSVVVLTYPSNVYGFVTDKRAGSDFLMLPVSVTEKFVSMIVNTVIVVPLIFLLSYCIVDGAICLLDGRCGSALCVSAGEFMRNFSIELNMDQSPVRISRFLIFMSVVAYNLIFLLAAVSFKKHKILYPILILIGLQMALSMIIGPILTFVDWDSMENLITRLKDPSCANMAMWLWNTLSLVFYIVIDAGLAAAVWFRLKTLKH